MAKDVLCILLHMLHMYVLTQGPPYLRHERYSADGNFPPQSSDMENLEPIIRKIRLLHRYLHPPTGG